MLEASFGVDWKGHRFTTFPELLGIDDKGVYLTKRKGHHNIGDEKGGKLKGQLTTYQGKGSTIEWSQVPSFLISQAKGSQPVQIQNIVSLISGEMEGFDAIMKSLGANISSTYPTEEKMQDKFVRKWVDIKLKGGSPYKELKPEIDEFNKQQDALGEKGIPVEWSKITASALIRYKAKKISDKQ